MTDISSRRGPVLVWVMVAFGLCLATFLTYRYVPSLGPLGAPRLVIDHFAGPQSLAKWTVEGKVQVRDGVLVLEATAGDPFARAALVMPLRDGEEAFRIAVEARLVEVAGGDSPWERARIYLTGLLPGGKVAQDRHRDLLRAEGSSDWQRIEGIQPPPDRASEIVLVLRLQKASGRLEVRSLRVQALTETDLFRLLRGALVLGWAGWLIWGGALVGSLVSVRVALLLVLGGLLAGALFLAPHELRSALIEATAEAIGWHGRTERLAKAGHFLIFATMAGLARLFLARVPWMVLLVLLVLMAGIGEMLQFLAIDRRPSLRDWAINNAGVFAGFAAGSVLLWLARRAGERGARRDETPAAARSLPLGR